MAFLASLSGQSQGDGVAVGFAQDHLLLVNSVGTIFELGNVEAFLFFDILAFNFGDDDILGHTGLDWFRSGHIDGNFKGFVDQGNSVSLSLVFFTAVLVFTSTIMITITRRSAGGDLHGLGFVSISHL